jgi:hypothetical protein
MDLFDRWNAEIKTLSKGPARYSHEDMLAQTEALFAHYRHGTLAQKPEIPKRNPRDKHAAGSHRASRDSGKPPPPPHRASKPSTRTVQFTPKVVPPPAPRVIEIEPYEPDPRAVEFVRTERLKEPRTFVPERDDVGPDAHPDWGVARAKFPLLIDSLVYLKTSDGDHDYFVKLPGEDGPELRKRPKHLGAKSVSGLVSDLKPPFRRNEVAEGCADSCVAKLAKEFHLTVEETLQLLESANDVEKDKWAQIAGGGFSKEWHFKTWEMATERGTRIHAALEAYLQGKTTLEEAWERDPDIKLALQKYQELVKIPEFSHFTPENVCRVELSLWYEPYDIVGQADALFWVPGEPGLVDLVDWKGIDAKTLSKIDKKLLDYRPQIPMYVWLMYNSPDPVLRRLRVRNMYLVALPPTNQSGWTEARVHRVAYDPDVIQILLDNTRKSILQALKRKHDMALRANPSPYVEQCEAGKKRAR